MQVKVCKQSGKGKMKELFKKSYCHLKEEIGVLF